MLALSTYEPSSIVIRNCPGGRLKGGMQSQTAQGKCNCGLLPCSSLPFLLLQSGVLLKWRMGDTCIYFHFSNGCILFLKFLLLHLFIGWGMCGRSKGRFSPSCESWRTDSGHQVWQQGLHPLNHLTSSK